MPRIGSHGTAVDDLTVEQVLAAHAQFGRLDKSSTKAAMGANWPARWDDGPDGQGIFEPPSSDTKTTSEPHST